MHIFHLGVIVQAPDYATEKVAQEMLTDALTDAKFHAKHRVADAADAMTDNPKEKIYDTDIFINYSDFLVTDVSPAKRRLDWLLTHPELRLQGSDRTGWVIWTFDDKQYAAGRTAYAAIDDALTKEAL